MDEIDLNNPIAEDDDSGNFGDAITPNPENSEEYQEPSTNIRRIFDAKKTKPKAEKKPKVIPPKPRPGTLVKPLRDLYTSIGALMVPFDEPCGKSIIENAEPCAMALENLARENPAVRRALLAMVETSVWGQVIAAHAPILVTVVMHHSAGMRAAAAAGPTVTGVEDYLKQRQNGDGTHDG